MRPHFIIRRTRGLQFRIIALFLGLLLFVEIASLLLIGSGIDRGATASVGEDIQSAKRIFDRLLQIRADKLADEARLLTADFGFKSAVATRDAETLDSALANQAARIDADLAVFADSQFQIKAGAADTQEQLLRVIRRASASQGGQELVLINGQPHQIVVVPVRAPLPVGWVAMGFQVHASLLEDMRSLASVDAVLAVRGAPDEAWRLHAPTLQPEERAQFLTAWTAARDVVVSSDAGSTGDLLLQFPPSDGGRLHGTVIGSEVLLGRVDGQEAVAILMRSLREATAPYERLKGLLLLFTLAATVVFAIGAVMAARRITRPLDTLSRSARLLALGDYSQPVQLSGQDEIGRLAQGFEAMRLAVRARDQEVRRLAFEDDLTGLPNREQFRRILRAAVSAKEEARFAILMLDLDRFKHVNDVLGHRTGDQLLIEVARRLCASRQEGTVVARLGGDEFALLLPQARATTAQATAQDILRVFERPIALDGQTVDLGAGVGIACCPEDGIEPELLLRRAELAMYVAKRRQLGIVHYHPSHDGSSEESLSLLGELRTALEHEQLRLWLQPKVCLATGRVVAAEALVRWQHPVRGLVPPMQFIPFAEQTGFIRQLTHWVIERGAQALSRLAIAGAPIRLSINLSVLDLLDQDLPDKLQRLADKHGMAPVTMCLEITESAIMDDPQRALQTLERLHGMGFKLSIDDFGTGYSSLAYLKRLPVDELKIDKSFVLHMENDLADTKIVRSVIDLAHNLGLNVVAEGVETPKAWKMLLALGCDEAQGYLIAKPMPAEHFAEWLRDWQAPETQQIRLDSGFIELLA